MKLFLAHNETFPLTMKLLPRNSFIVLVGSREKPCSRAAKAPLKRHDETNPKSKIAENPCRTRLFSKKKEPQLRYLLYHNCGSYLVRATGLEPACLSTYEPKSYVSSVPPRPHMNSRRGSSAVFYFTKLSVGNQEELEKPSLR